MIHFHSSTGFTTDFLAHCLPLRSTCTQVRVKMSITFHPKKLLTHSYRHAARTWAVTVGVVINLVLSPPSLPDYSIDQFSSNITLPIPSGIRSCAQYLDSFTTMLPSVNTIVDEYVSVIWPVQSFEISDHKSPGPARLLFDRANAEFGLIYENGPGISVMAKFPDTEDAIYFQVSKVRAACTRFNNTCKKFCVLAQNFQLDLHFTTNTHASEFLQKLARTATKVGNLHFEVHEAAS